MKYDDFADGITPEAIASLRLPATFDEAIHKTAMDIDAVLGQDERPVATLDAKVAAHREVTLSHLKKFHGKQIFDPHFPWPSYLFIPKGTLETAPADHRYALAWTSPGSAPPNQASVEDGTLTTFSQLHNESANTTQSTESGVGVFYKPPMTLGVVDFQPQVDCSGTLRTFLNFFPQLAAGQVEVKAQLLLAAWQPIPGGFDLLGFKSFNVATSGLRDQSHGPELREFQSSFDGSAPFVVQLGRTYLLGVVSRIIVSSTLTDNHGAPLPNISSNLLKVWGVMNCVVPLISVLTKRVDIP
jgi:hypothetical protein